MRPFQGCFQTKTYVVAIQSLSCLLFEFYCDFKISWKTIIYLLAPKSSEKDEQHIGRMETLNPWTSKKVDKSTNFPVVPRRIPWRCCFCEFGKPWSPMGVWYVRHPSTTKTSKPAVEGVPIYLISIQGEQKKSP